MNDDNDKIRAHYEQALQQLWLLEEDLETYVNDEVGSRTGHAIPDFSSTVDRLVGSPVETQQDIQHCSLSRLEEIANGCTACKLSSTRSHVVFGEGAVPAQVMIIGEGPGADEDACGHPFVGRAGQYLDRWLASIHLSRTQHVYIANIVKCRPPGNRNPEPDEISACIGYLKRQIELVQPKSILCLGRVAAHNLLDCKDSLQSLRNRWFRYQSVPLMVTYHPSAVLRNPSLRASVWEDLKRLAAFLEINLTEPTR